MDMGYGASKGGWGGGKGREKRDMDKHVHTHIHMYVCIYIYIHTSLSIYISLSLSIYIYIYTHYNIYIYTHRERERERERERDSLRTIRRPDHQRKNKHSRESRILALVGPRMQAAGLRCLKLQIADPFALSEAEPSLWLQRQRLQSAGCMKLRWLYLKSSKGGFSKRQYSQFIRILFANSPQKLCMLFANSPQSPLLRNPL